MTTNNAINNTLGSPFTVGATSVTTTGTQLNLLNTLTAAPFDIITIQTFTTTGTYTPSAGMKYALIEVVGGGAAAGGNQAVTTGGSTGSGGGSGGYSRGIFTAATIGASQAVTIGAGGTGVSGANGN